MQPKASSEPGAPDPGTEPVGTADLLEAVAAASAVSGVLPPPLYSQACALRPSGSPECWGSWMEGEPPAGVFTAVGLGDFSCGLRSRRAGSVLAP